MIKMQGSEKGSPLMRQEKEFLKWVFKHLSATKASRD